MSAELKLDVDSIANMVPAQKAIKRAFDRFRLVIVPNNLSEFTVRRNPSCSCVPGGFAIFTIHTSQTTGFVVYRCIFWTLHWVLR